MVFYCSHTKTHTIFAVSRAPPLDRPFGRSLYRRSSVRISWRPSAAFVNRLPSPVHRKMEALRARREDPAARNTERTPQRARRREDPAVREAGRPHGTGGAVWCFKGFLLHHLRVVVFT